MLVLRKYQLDVIFLFFAVIVFVWLSFFALEYFWVADPHDYEWFIAGPLVIFYLGYLLNVRSKINLADHRRLTGKTMVYWIALGVTTIMSYSSPISARDYWSINLLFILFSLLLADSYWDFKKLSINSFRDKKEF